MRNIHHGRGGHESIFQIHISIQLMRSFNFFSDMQVLDAADQQRTPEAGSLKTCSDDKKKASMVSVLCDSSDKDVHHISAECNNVLME